MERVKVDIKNPDSKIIKKAARILTTGGVIVYPTDTAYGLGANALSENSIYKLYEIKGRDFSKPTHVVVTDWEMIKNLTFANDPAKKLYNSFMPGPLTIILQKKSIVPNILTASLPTLGVRIPNSLISKSLSRKLSFPYTTPSANRSGEKTPYSVEEVEKVIDISKVDLILDAGKLPNIPPSTIVDLTTDDPKILRQGPIKKEEIEKALAQAKLRL